MVVTWMLPGGGEVTPNTVAHGGDLPCEDPGAERAGGRRGTCQGPAVGPAKGTSVPAVEEEQCRLG